MPENKKYTYVDHLNEDDPISNQKWMCVSFLSPEGIANCKIRGLKIRGVYSTKEEADVRAEELRDIDIFDVHVGEVGKWLAWDADPNNSNDQVYKEKELNNLMIQHKKSIQKAKELESERKADMVNDAIKEERDRRKNEKSTKKDYVADAFNKLDSKGSKLSKSDRKKLKKKLSQEHKKANSTTDSTYPELEEQKHKANEERERLSDVNSEINKKKDELKTVDAQYDKIKKLYQKLQQKESSAVSNN